MNPKISVITVCYNSASTIEETIISIISQDYDNYEYIIIDGASKDDTPLIVNRYKDNISVFVSESDNGISEAFNKGIRYATGDLIVLINADDYLLPNVLSRVARNWDGVSDILSGNYLALNEASNEKYRIRPSLSFPVMPFFCKPVHQARFITKRLYNRIGGYDESIRVPMDLEFLMRADRLNARFQYIDIDVAVFRLGGATSNSILGKKKDYLACVTKNGGNIVQAYFFYYFLVVTQLTKQLVFKTGKDMVRMFRYRRA